MILLIGLGNPGEKFVNTRHNLGFDFLDYLYGLGDFSPWQEKKRLQSIISRGLLFDKEVVLAKPQTFMNNSGEAVVKLLRFYKLPLSCIWVVHDDIDLLLGSFKIVKNRGAAGHNGVKSIIQSLNNKNFVRFRIGIKPKKFPKNYNRKVFVLEKFTKKEQKVLEKVKKDFAKATKMALQNDIQKAMTEFNKKRSAA
ncbi:aminoacyl-tRNA hydrolase [bacterium]|nr:aminoacyl-tRNA hydrolase [bacterium]